jgi:flagellar biogenesis protein FliO
MNGYQYLIARNRLMIKLDDELTRLAPLAEAERQAQTRKLQQKFDDALAELYAQVATEYPGERRT